MRTATTLDLAVLGRLEVRRDGTPVDLGTPRQRAILAALALADGRPVRFDALVERVWGDAAPATAVSTMQRYVADLRRALEPDRTADRAPAVLVTRGTAYALLVPAGRRDTDRLQEAVAGLRQALAVVPDPWRPAAPSAHAAAITAAIGPVDDALRLWRGEPYADLGDHDGSVVAERARLRDLRDAAVEQRLVALLALGRHAETLGELESLTTRQPLHERWWALRAVALVRSGRQSEALDGLSTMRTTLAEELGVDPSPPLQALLADILRQDASLSWAAAAPSLPPRRPTSATSAMSPACPAPPLPRWPLVGRAAEHAVLTALLDEHRGHGRIGLLTGEPGIGKTRLVQELARTAHQRGVALATARCRVGAPALWAIRTALAAPAIGADVDVELEPDAFARGQQVADALRRATYDAPVLLVLEDLQHADPATLDLLERLAGEDDLGALTLVLTLGTTEVRHSRLAAAVTRAGGVRIDLGPLPTAAGARLARTVAPDVADPASVSHRAGGNPLLLTAVALGAGPADVVRARVADLPPDVRTALGLASALTGPVDAERVAALAGWDRDAAETALDAALRAGLLAGERPEPATYRFAHEVVREVLYADLPAATRSRCRRQSGWPGVHRPVPAALPLGRSGIAS